VAPFSCCHFHHLVVQHTFPGNVFLPRTQLETASSG
jgi:hypothetical protein